MKTKILGGLFAFLLGILVWNGDSMTVNAEEYTYQDKQVETAEGTQTVKQWYSGTWDNRVESDGPIGLSNEELKWSPINFYTAPDEETAEWLKSLSGDVVCYFMFCLPDDAVVQISTPENPLTMVEGQSSTVTVQSGTVNVYGDLQGVDLMLDYDSENATVRDLNVYGNVKDISMGWLDEWGRPNAIDGNIFIDGNVLNKVQIAKTTQLADHNAYFKGFIGNATVTGTVAGGVIKEAIWDEALLTCRWYDSGIIGSCEAGIFRITDGVLSSNVPVENKEPEVEEYNFVYECHPGHQQGDPNIWNRTGYIADTGAYAFSQVWEQDRIPEEAHISVYGISQPFTLERNLVALEVHNSGQHTQKGTPSGITVKGNVGWLSLDIYRYSPFDVNIDGTVEQATILYRYSPTCNVTVSGGIQDARWSHMTGKSASAVGDFAVGANVSMITAGVWNSDLVYHNVLMSNPTPYEVELPFPDFQAINDALDDEDLNREITVDTADGEKTLQKESTVNMAGTSDEALAEVEQKEEMTSALEQLIAFLKEKVEEVLSTETIFGMDITLGTYYVDVASGEIYNDDPNYASEEITELAEGNSIPFTINIPEDSYDENKEYNVIREHRNPDGSVRMDVLETTRNGKKLSFRSDRFSTFVVVAAEVEGQKEDSTPTPTPGPTPTPQPTPNPSPAPAPAPEPTPAPVVNTNPYQVPTTVLRTGSTQKDAVLWLQTELKAAGYQLAVDGLFGKGTRAALMDYQLRHGLAVDGICGKMTINALLNDGSVAQTPAVSGSGTNSYPAPTRIIRMGQGNRTEVRWLQTELVQAGYQLAVDGLFGPGTRAALMDYQLRHGLAVDGICGPKTIQSMISQ